MNQTVEKEGGLLTPDSAGLAEKNPDLQKRVSEKAYELYQKRGEVHGNDLADWLEAERIVKDEINSKKGLVRKSKGGLVLKKG